MTTAGEPGRKVSGRKRLVKLTASVGLLASRPSKNACHVSMNTPVNGAISSFAREVLANFLRAHAVVADQEIAVDGVLVDVPVESIRPRISSARRPGFPRCKRRSGLA